MWSKLDDRFWRHPKVRRLLDMGPRGFAAIGLWTITQSWIGEELTDGRIPSRQPMRLLGDDPAAAIEALIGVGLWERAGDDFQVHGYLDYNPSRAQVLADRAQRSEAGKLGAKARWDPDGESHSGRHSEPHGEVPYDSPLPSRSSEPTGAVPAATRVGASGAGSTLTNGESHGGMDGGMDAPYPVSRVPVTQIPRVPAQARETWPTDIPTIVQNAWHRRMKRPPTAGQIGALRKKPGTWFDVALLIDGSPPVAKAGEIISHVLDGLTAKLATERLEEEGRAVEKVPGKPGGDPTKVGLIIASVDVSGGPR